MKKTKIVCTIGPSSNNEEMLRKMIAAGMNVARFNFSHGSHETQKANLDLVKKVREEMGVAVATMMDTKGPEIRFRDFENGKISLEKGQDKIYHAIDLFCCSFFLDRQIQNTLYRQFIFLLRDFWISCRTVF